MGENDRMVIQNFFTETLAYGLRKVNELVN